MPFCPSVIVHRPHIQYVSFATMYAVSLHVLWAFHAVDVPFHVVDVLCCCHASNLSHDPLRSRFLCMLPMGNVPRGTFLELGLYVPRGTLVRSVGRLSPTHTQPPITIPNLSRHPCESRILLYVNSSAIVLPVTHERYKG